MRPLRILLMLGLVGTLAGCYYDPGPGYGGGYGGGYYSSGPSYGYGGYYSSGPSYYGGYYSSGPSYGYRGGYGGGDGDWHHRRHWNGWGDND
jgi:hypothetical protein